MKKYLQAAIKHDPRPVPCFGRIEELRIDITKIIRGIGWRSTRTNNGSQVLFIILVGVFGRLFSINSITYHDVVHGNVAHT